MDCYFCKKGIEQMDFKDLELIERFVSGSKKIRAKKRTGTCASHQRRLAVAIKRARFIGLSAFTAK